MSEIQDSTGVWTPGKILEVSGFYWRTCTLHAGVKLDVFTVIGDSEKTGSEVAVVLHSNPRATEMLLNGLAAMGLLAKTGNKFANTAQSREFLCKDSQNYIGFMVMHHHHLVESWSRLDESVVSGQPLRKQPSFEDPERLESFLMGMFNIAMTTVPGVLKVVDLSGRSRLLDLGGGPGTYAIHFCMENPDLQATVYDLGATRPFAEKTIERFGLSDRITFMEGDYTSREIEGSWDAAWLSHILHGEGPDQCRDIIRKTASVLEPGGWIGIHEFILDNPKDGPLFPALFSLNMLLGTPSGQAYSEEELMGFLREAGFGNIQRLPFVGPNESGIVCGEKIENT